MQSLLSIVFFTILYKIGGFPLKKKLQLKRDSEMFDRCTILHLQTASGFFKKLQQRMGISFSNRVVANKIMRRMSLHYGDSDQFSDDMLVQAFRFQEMFGDRLAPSYANMARMCLRGYIQSPASQMTHSFQINVYLASRLAEIGHRFYKCQDCTGLLARCLSSQELAKDSVKRGSLDGYISGLCSFDGFTLMSLDDKTRCMMDHLSIEHDNLDGKIDDNSDALTDWHLLHAELLYVGNLNLRIDIPKAKQLAESLLHDHGHPGAYVLLGQISFNDAMLNPYLTPHQKKSLLQEAKRLLDSARSIGYSDDSLMMIAEGVDRELARMARI
jgi:hypothetical protein